eukprot:TRINITY_DN121138_c0_g1_i1.p1 TRINITY_DN121138_c0_g1~~TRINITY_DN121138_c0_g1_i1.p1  ORF type:complete len:351 (+),score=54.57 TRINITY_DN121138_c0_g1_i1:66-1118(+)
MATAIFQTAQPPAGELDDSEFGEVPVYRFQRRPRRPQQEWSLKNPRLDDVTTREDRGPPEADAQQEENGLLLDDGGSYSNDDDPCAYIYDGHGAGYGWYGAYNPYGASVASSTSHDRYNKAPPPPGLEDWQDDGQCFGASKRMLSSEAALFSPSASWHHYQVPSELSTWSLDATRVGTLSPDGHTLAHSASGRKRQAKGECGASIQLNSLTLLCSSAHHPSGTKTYNFCLSEGVFGKADGVGFAFDTCVRRRCIKDMHTVFYSANGRICLRSGGAVRKLEYNMPHLVQGAVLQVVADLDNFMITFLLLYADHSRQIDVDLSRELDDCASLCSMGGFLCCVVSETCDVNLW